MNIIALTWEVSLGKEGEDRDPTTPLSRSLNRLFDTGQPFKRLTQCFVAEVSSTEEPVNYKLRWFGVFVLSHGDRIIFFPGLTTSKKHVQGYNGRHKEWDQEFEIDHISLEKDWNRWHLTSPQSKTHLGSIGTSDLGYGRRLWFGMSLTDFATFRLLSQKTTVVTQSPPSDADRRVQVFHQARENAEFQIIEPHPDSGKKYDPGFFHISVIVGPSGFALYKGENHGFPIDSPFLREPLSEQILGIPIRYHRVALSSDIDLQITMTKLPGALRLPVMFTVIDNPNNGVQATAVPLALHRRA